MTQASITEWFAGVVKQSEAAVAVVLDMMRKNGERLAEFVIIVADTKDEATRFFVEQLLDAPLAPSVPGYVGAIPKGEVARVLRLMDAEAYAANADKELEEGWMRVLVIARGRVECADLPALPHARGGSA